MDNLEEADGNISGIAPLTGDLTDMDAARRIYTFDSIGRSNFYFLSTSESSKMPSNPSVVASADVNNVTQLATLCPAVWTDGYDNSAIDSAMRKPLFPDPQIQSPSPQKPPAAQWESPESGLRCDGHHTTASIFSQEKVRQKLNFCQPEFQIDPESAGPTVDDSSLPTSKHVAAASVESSGRADVVDSWNLVPDPGPDPNGGSTSGSAAVISIPQPVMSPAAFNESGMSLNDGTLFSPLRGEVPCAHSSSNDDDTDKENLEPPLTALKQPVLRPRQAQEEESDIETTSSESFAVETPHVGQQGSVPGGFATTIPAETPHVGQQGSVPGGFATTIPAETPHVGQQGSVPGGFATTIPAETPHVGQQGSVPGGFATTIPAETPHVGQQGSVPGGFATTIPAEVPSESRLVKITAGSLNGVSSSKSLPSSAQTVQLQLQEMQDSVRSTLNVSADNPRIEHMKQQLVQNLSSQMQAELAKLPLSPTHLFVKSSSNQNSPLQAQHSIQNSPIHQQPSFSNHNSPIRQQHHSQVQHQLSSLSSENSPMKPHNLTTSQEALVQMMATHQDELKEIQAEITAQRESARMIADQDNSDMSVPFDGYQIPCSMAQSRMTGHQSMLGMTSGDVSCSGIHEKPTHDAAHTKMRVSSLPNKSDNKMRGIPPGPSSLPTQLSSVHPSGATHPSSLPTQLSSVHPSGATHPASCYEASGQNQPVTTSNPPFPAMKDSRQLMDSSIISSIHGDKRDTIGSLLEPSLFDGTTVSQTRASSTPLTARTHGQTQGRGHRNVPTGNLSVSSEIQSMEVVRNHLSNMLQMTNLALPGNEQFDETKDEVSCLLGELARELDNNESMMSSSSVHHGGPKNLLDLNAQLESLLSQGSSHHSSAAKQATQAPSLLMAENHMLKETIEKEKFRRKHLEKEIQQNQEKMLELQQQLAVAISTDRKKDAMIEQLDKTLAKVVEGWKLRESQKTELINTLQQETTQLCATQDHQQQLLKKYEQELAQTVDLLSSERTQASEKEAELAKQSRELNEELSHSQKLLELERTRCNSLHAERAQLAQVKEKLQDQLLVCTQTLDAERESFEEKENEYLQKIDEITENHLKAVEQERSQRESQSQVLTETQHALQTAQKNEQDLLIKLDTATREKESFRVEMGLLEARMESSKRKLEADLRAEKEKQITAKLEEAHQRQVASEEDIRERHRNQVTELNQRHSQEMEDQLEQYHDNISKRDEKLAMVTKEYEHKLSGMRQELEAAQHHAQKLHSQRALTSQKLQSMMQHHCNEALRLLQMGAIGNTPTQAHVQGSGTASHSSNINNQQGIISSVSKDAFGSSLPVSKLPSEHLPEADISLPVNFSSAPPPGTIQPLPLISWDNDSSSDMLEYTQQSGVPIHDSHQTFEDMFQAAMATTLANQSFSLSTNQQSLLLSNQNPSFAMHDSIQVTEIPAYDEHHNLAESSVLHKQIPFSSNVPNSVSNFPYPSAAAQQPQFQHSTRDQTLRPIVQQSNVPDSGQLLMSNRAHPEGFLEYGENPSSDLLFHLRHRQESGDIDGASEDGFAPLTADVSLSTTMDEVEWHRPHISHTSAGQYHRGVTTGNTQQQSHHQGNQLQQPHGEDNMHEARTTAMDYSEISEKFDEHESRQSELQRYIQLLLDKSPGETSMKGSHDESNITAEAENLLASVAESFFSPHRSQPGPLTFSGKGQFEGGTQNKQSAFTKTVMTSSDRQQMGTSASSVQGALSPRQVGEITRLLGRYRQGDSAQAPPVQEFLSYLRDLAPNQAESTPTSSPEQSHIPQRGPPSQEAAKVKRNLASTFQVVDKKNVSKPTHSSATKAGSPKQNRSQSAKHLPRSNPNVLKPIPHQSKNVDKKPSTRGGNKPPVWK